MNYYSAVAFICCLAMLVLAILVADNNRLSTDLKRKLHLSYGLIIASILSEWLSAYLNGTPETMMGIHNLILCLYHMITPAVGACFIAQLVDSKSFKKFKWVVGVLLVNGIASIISMATGWMYYIDQDNYYHDGSLYLIYVLTYVAVIIGLFIAVIDHSKKYKKENRRTAFAIFMLLLIGSLIQEIVGDDIRVVCIAITFTSIFLLLHYIGFVEQDMDVQLSRQQLLIDTDALTGVLSRYAFQEALENYRKQSELPTNLAVVILDINGMKTTNDRKGHLAGDELIIETAKYLLRVICKYGKCFRVGGDEFVAIIEISKEKLLEIQEDLSGPTKALYGEPLAAFSVSMGYALREDHPEASIIELIDIADEMMYKKKENYYERIGGHQIGMHDDGTQLGL